MPVCQRSSACTRPEWAVGIFREIKVTRAHSVPRRLALALLVSFFIGCGESPPPSADGGAESAGPSTVRQFKIGGKEFGIDPEASSFTLDTTDPGRPTITVEIAGDRSVFDPLTAEEDSEWSWALYPPGFYLRSFPAQIDPSTGAATARVTLNDLDGYEFAILMMAHNDIDDVSVTLVPDKSVDVSGRVDLFGEVHDFVIHRRR